MQPFEKTQYTNKTFVELNACENIFTSISFLDCIFNHCSLTECEFKKCTFEKCRFEKSDLSLAKFPLTTFSKNHFIECRLLGINWCQADWQTRSLLPTHRLDFEGCHLDHGTFIGLDLKVTSFIRSKARYLDFESADLTHADFRDADLEGTRFVGCDLTEANFVGAENYQIDAAQNTLHKTRFSLPEAVALLHSLDIVLED